MKGLWLLAALLLFGCEPHGARIVVSDKEQPIDLSGHWLLVNYWAIWCKPCVKEIPEMNALADAEPTLMVLGVNFDAPPPALLRRQRDQMAIRFPLLISNPTELGLIKPSVLPTTYIINPQGKLVATLLGPQTQASLQQALKSSGF